jgi:hypothetical protein
MYIRVGNIVQVVLELSVDATSASASYSFRVTLPVASNFTVATDAAGLLGRESVHNGRITAEPTNNALLVECYAGTGGGVAASVAVTAMYQVK